MSNNDPLTDEELGAYRLNVHALERLEACRRKLALTRADFRVLDWGCGRGKAVLWLREQGYDAHGVDVDAAAFANGVDLFRRKGHRFEDCVRALGPDGTAPFPDASFHFVLSDQVLEHIADLPAAVGEIRRLTAPGGEGFHIFPPHRRIVEPHLFMPLVHWLPKNRLRKWAIALCVAAGVEPHWWAKGTIAFSEKVRVYHAFSVGETFYRPHDAIRAAFAAAGIAAGCVDVCHYGARRRLVDALPLLDADSAALRFWYTRFAADLGLATRLAG